MSHTDGCEEMESLIVQRVYGESLTEAEDEHVGEHMNTCASCRESEEEVRRLVHGIPKDDFVYEGDLLPAIHESLRRPGRIPLQWIFTGGALVLVLFMGAVFMALPRQQHEGVLLSRSEATPVDMALVEAEVARNDGDYAKAYVILTDAVKENTDDASAGEAVLTAGEIAYGDLGWYPQARMLYRQAQSEYTEAFSAVPDAVRRYNILEEAYSIDPGFESLYALDAALRRHTMTALEGYMTRYPGTFTASDAAHQMAMLAIDEADHSEDWTLAEGYEAAMASTTNPLAVASLKMELAHEYTQDDGDVGKARALLLEVAESGSTRLAQRARTSLDILDATP